MLNENDISGNFHKIDLEFEAFKNKTPYTNTTTTSTWKQYYNKMIPYCTSNLYKILLIPIIISLLLYFIIKPDIIYDKDKKVKKTHFIGVIVILSVLTFIFMYNL